MLIKNTKQNLMLTASKLKKMAFEVAIALTDRDDDEKES